MQSIEKTFRDFLQRHFQCSAAADATHNLVKCGVEAVKLGLLHKDCVNGNGTCLAVMLLEYAVHSVEREACMPFLDEFFAMKPCLRNVWTGLPRYYLHTRPYVKFCMSFEYLWNDPLAVQHYWWAMPMDVRKKWSPCRVAWIWAVIQ